MIIASPIWLGSASPRRRQLLQEAGLDVHVSPSDLDDGRLRRGSVTPRQWVMALAYFKARRVAEILTRTAGSAESPGGTVLAADTVCVQGESILGQPADADHARSMLRTMRNHVHQTITGVCLLPLGPGPRLMFVDQAEVHVGPLTDVQIDSYVDSGGWWGKAGAYNLAERIADGWPIQCRGDPATVMGLPMRRLRGLMALGEN
ncbi:MAG: Maf-like protein [Phycisphaerales bacterium]|nr:MAG: Maf-like protein [Phycisphaerales bacterium]